MNKLLATLLVGIFTVSLGVNAFAASPRVSVERAKAWSTLHNDHKQGQASVSTSKSDTHKSIEHLPR